MQIPKVGFIKVFTNARSILKNPLPFHHKNFEKHGDNFLVQVGPKSSVMFTRDAGFTKHMLQKNHRSYQKSSLQTRDLGKYIGNGLLTANGDYWLKQRRLIQPAFHKKKIEGLLQTILGAIDTEVAKIREEKEIDIYPLMSDLAFQVVAKSLFTYTDNQGTIERLQYITEEVQKSLIKEIRQPYKGWWFHLSGQLKQTFGLANEARELLLGIIQDRKKSATSHHDLLDMLLETRYDDGTAMTDDQLIDELLILFTAGHETTSNALTFTLQLLALHPEIQNKVWEEVKQFSEETLATLEGVGQLTYTQQCIEEAMRLYPPVYFSDRVATADDAYEKMEIKKKTTVLISFYEIHRHQDFWENADTFDPDRFHKGFRKENANWYFPFGAGPRMCIGNNFAMYEMMMSIAQVIKKYQLQTSKKEIEYTPLITLKPDQAYLTFHIRK